MLGYLSRQRLLHSARSFCIHIAVLIGYMRAAPIIAAPVIVEPIVRVSITEVYLGLFTTLCNTLHLNHIYVMLRVGESKSDMNVATLTI